MALVEIARFTDVYEADLAAASLASHGVEIDVTERFQTTIDPLMQRALGLRLMGRAEQVEQARTLLARAMAGEFATETDDDLPSGAPAVRSISPVWRWPWPLRGASPELACRVAFMPFTGSAVR